MKLITRQTRANESANNWKKTYFSDVYNDGECYSVWRSNEDYEKNRRIMKLGDNPSPDSVDEIIGNDSWTRAPSCNECGVVSVAVIQIGEVADYDSATANVCKPCIIKALAKFEEIEGK